ncbi:MAG: adenylate kinase family protein [Thermoplasmata archaeon]
MQVEVYALTGTPGCGKTQTANILRKKGIEVLDLNEFAKKCGATTRYLKRMATWEVDLHILSEKAWEVCRESDEEILVIEGHLSHLLDCVTRIIVLRCAPSLLYTRLKKKKWKEEKIWENVEAEAIDLILIESIETGNETFEIDTTCRDAARTAACVVEIFEGNDKEYKPGRICWSADFIDLMEKKKYAGKLQKKGRPIHFEDCEML